METLMTVGEVARKLRLTEAAIRSYVLKRKIPFRKVGAAVRFKESEIDEWINSGCPAGVRKALGMIQPAPETGGAV